MQRIQTRNNTDSNASKVENDANLKRTKDIFELAGVEDEDTVEDIMAKVREILALAQQDVEENFNSIKNPKSFVEMYMDLIDIRKKPIEPETTEVFIPNQSDNEDDLGNIDYTDELEELQTDNLNDSDRYAFPELLEDIKEENILRDYG